MKLLEVAEAVDPLSQYAQKISQEPVILTVDGRPVAALFSVEDTDWEALTLSTHPQFLALIERSRERQKREGGISAEEMRKRLGV